ncbi:MAG: DNA-directed RNA polymerase subunit L [Methanobacteriota archaeon]
MQVRLLSKTEKTLEIEIADENETFLNLLKSKCLASDKVASATYLLGHPALDKPRFVLEVRSGNPEAVLKAAVKEIRAELDHFDDLLVKMTKQ